MNKFIVEVLHEEIISEESMLTVTGGINPSACGNADSCNINDVHCPVLTCIGNHPLICLDKMTQCKGNMIECGEDYIACPYDMSSIH